MKLIIVESPAKCSTIERYLGKNYIVKASKGHIRDLSMRGKGGLGVNIEEGFEPNYIISKGKSDVVRELMAAQAKCDEVILATDPDREGEAIAWHLAVVLGLDVETTKRLEFHEITRDSINKAIENPRTIDMKLVAAQEARRILDRIIGFILSGMIQRKIKSRSAGRVQTPTLKLIYDHEKEIETFVPEEYWDLEIKVKDALEHTYSVSIVNSKNEAIDVINEEQAKMILESINNELVVCNVEKFLRPKESKEPFTTSTLQQEAFSKLKFKTQKTQKIAQKLYEGFDVGGEHMGLITYMRTDSTRLSSTYITKATNFILETYGKEFLGKVKTGKQSANSQDAHEAIRPTSNHKTPESVKPFLTPDEYHLYKLIYNRALSSLMKPRIDEVYTVTLEGKNDIYFKFEMEKTIFKGFEILDSHKETQNNVVDYKIGDKFLVSTKEAKQKFTQPPAHYSEAKIVKIMEEAGIGRPSTYAPTIFNLIQSRYILDNKGIVNITEQGSKTAHVLHKYFPEVVEPSYTAKLEKHLDNIETGKESRIDVLTNFYSAFMVEVDKANKIMYSDGNVKVGRPCPKCGADLVIREGKYGSFVGCENFPKCSYVEKEEKAPPKETGEFCPLCGKPLVERKDKKGKILYACSNFPKCKYVKPDKDLKDIAVGEKTDKICPKCGSPLLKKKGKYGYFLGCSNYPNCNYMEKFKKRK